METVKIANVTVASEFQMRVKSDPATLIEYRELIRASEEHWPFDEPCTLYRVDGTLILTDGFHRLEAMHAEGRTEIRANVRNGTLLDAKIASLGANKNHGLKRSNADKRRAGTIAVQDETLRKWSDRKLAELCGISDFLVSQIRAELPDSCSSARESTVGADGKNRPANREKSEQQRVAIRAAIDKSPIASDREIAEKIGCDGKTVGKVRRDIQQLKTEPPAAVISPEREVAPAPASVILAEPLTHVERLERLIALLKDEINDLKRVEGWAATKERCAAVRAFMKTYRRIGNEFEKYTTVGAEPVKTLFESDADIPEHLSTQEFLTVWNSWWKHRQQRKLSVSDTTKKRQLNLLKIGDAEQAAAIVSKAEENKWQGIPDGIWIPTRNYGLWCDRMPAHASAELNGKIQAALPKVNGAGQTVVQPIKVDRSAFGSRNNPEFEKLSPEEQRKAILKRK
jgi:hypothetical protein